MLVIQGELKGIKVGTNQVLVHQIQRRLTLIAVIVEALGVRKQVLILIHNIKMEHILSQRQFMIMLVIVLPVVVV